MKRIDPGIAKMIASITTKRSEWLRSLKSGQSVVKITIRKNGGTIYGIYKCHSDSTITVRSSVGLIDHVMRGKTLVLSSMDLRSEDITFNFLDIQMTNS